MLTRDPYKLQIALDDAHDRMQHLIDTLAAVVHAAGGSVTIRPLDVAAARGAVVQFDATQAEDRIEVRLRGRASP